MQISPWFIWLSEMCEKILLTSTVTFTISAFAVFIIMFIHVMSDDDDQMPPRIRKTLKISLVVFAISCLLMLCQSQKTLIAMKVIPAVTQSRQLQKLPAVVDKFLDQYLESSNEHK